MVDSDIKCTLCGVSFNIARLRTVDEPREYAWNPYSNDTPGRAFAWNYDGARHDEPCPSADRDYQGQRGCMAAFREDVAWRDRGRRGRHRRKSNESRTWDDIVFDGLEEHRIDLELSEEEDDNWIPGDYEGDEQMSDEEMQYEFGSVSESCEGEIIEMSDHENGSNDDEGYHDWVANKLLAPTVYPCGTYLNAYVNDNNIDHFRKMQQLAEEFRVKVPTEVSLPWRVPVASSDETLDWEEGINEQPSSGCDSQTGTITAPYSVHPLNILGGDKLEAVWEHLSGPDCCCTAGYSGSRISVEEMLNCNVVQGILQKSSQWEVEGTDEEWEADPKSRWYLTGIKDNIDGSGNSYLDRHQNQANTNTFHFDYVNWDTGELSMAFHPRCLEVFKRVSLKRNGRFDINGLGDWWLKAGNYKEIWDLPRHEDVSIGAGHEEKWAHGIGTEYIAANPCYISVLKKMLASCKKATSKNPATTALHDLPDLPVEIQHSIISYLEIKDIASLSAASPSLRSTTELMLKKRLLDDMPYLWELWCDLPYSKWACTTVAEIKAAQAAFDEQEEGIFNILAVLQEEGYDEAYAEYKEFWDASRAERKAKSQIPLQARPSDSVSIEEIDVPRFVYELEKAREHDQIKGLKNRARIWVDCNTILDRVEALQREGRIPPSQG